MPKSLEMSSGGLGFEEFMRKIVNASIPAKKPRKSRPKLKKPDRKQTTTP